MSEYSREDFETLDLYEQKTNLFDELIFRLIERLKNSKTTNVEFVELSKIALKVAKFIEVYE